MMQVSEDVLNVDTNADSHREWDFVQVYIHSAFFSS